jgi:uncharacterized protein
VDSLDSFTGESSTGIPTILYKHRAALIDESAAPGEVGEKRARRGRESQFKRYLIVSDLHIGFEERFRGAGVSLEPQIKGMIQEISQMVEDHKVTDLLINGDVKSGVDRILPSEWENVPKFFETMLAMCRVSVIPGNHDGGLKHLLPSGVELLDSGGTMISGNLIMHGHTRPLSKFHDCKRLFIGHVHPIYQKKGSPLSGQPVWVFFKADREEIFRTTPRKNSKDEADITNRPSSNDLSVIVMPSFNLELIIAGYATDAAKQERKIAPILRDLKNTNEAMITTLDGELIGDRSLLPNVL